MSRATGPSSSYFRCVAGKRVLSRNPSSVLKPNQPQYRSIGRGDFIGLPLTVAHFYKYL